MRYYKLVNDGYIDLIGTGYGHDEITEEEYNNILTIIHNYPTPPEGKGYRLRTDLTLEEYDLPVVESSDNEVVSISLGGATE